MARGPKRIVFTNFLTFRAENLASTFFHFLHVKPAALIIRSYCYYYNLLLYEASDIHKTLPIVLLRDILWRIGFRNKEKALPQYQKFRQILKYSLIQCKIEWKAIRIFQLAPALEQMRFGNQLL